MVKLALLLTASVGLGAQSVPDRAMNGPGLLAQAALTAPEGATRSASPVGSYPASQSSEGPIGAWTAHGQTTYILQGHGAFFAPYEGPNSFLSKREVDGSFSATFYLGIRPWAGGEFFVTPELLGGKGMSSVLGLAASPNGEIYRVNGCTVKPSLSRLFLRQTWNLDSGTTQTVEDGPMTLAGTRSSHRFTVTAGKVAMNDIYDLNTYVGDPRSGFMNWAIMDTGSWDYPADTRGYSWGLTVEMAWDAWSARLGSYMEPKQANQMSFDPQLDRAHGDTLELEHDHHLGEQAGKVSLMVYANHARMGNYQEALALDPTAPVINATEQPGRVKNGYSLNVEQALTPELGVFLRAGWNDGRTESWAFTEIDRTLVLGLAAQGGAWGRPNDRLGVALVTDGLSKDHRAYLAAGGLGFLLGDGRLNYAQEQVLETYYALAVGKSFACTLDYQRVWNPAYNRDRGPVDLFAARLHAQF